MRQYRYFEISKYQVKFHLDCGAFALELYTAVVLSVVNSKPTALYMESGVSLYNSQVTTYFTVWNKQKDVLPDKRIAEYDDFCTFVELHLYIRMLDEVYSVHI